MSTSVIIPLASGCEEMEAVILIDTFRRADWKVVAAGVDDQVIDCSRNVRLLADASWEDLDVSSFDMIVLPGGQKGTDRLMTFQPLLDALVDFHQRGKTVAAVCAGPLVLQQAGILEDVEFTSHPSVADRFTDKRHLLTPCVVIDGTIVTSQGPGTSFAFALALVAMRDGQATADALASGMILPPKGS